MTAAAAASALLEENHVPLRIFVYAYCTKVALKKICMKREQNVRSTTKTE